MQTAADEQHPRTEGRTRKQLNLRPDRHPQQAERPATPIQRCLPAQSSKVSAPGGNFQHSADNRRRQGQHPA